MILTRESVVTKRILEKQKLLKAGDERHKEIRVALISTGGCMASIFGAGCLLGLELSGLELGGGAIDNFVASSAGAANVAYSLSEQGLMGISIYYQDLISPQFINFYRPWKIVNIDFLENIFRLVKVLDVPKMNNSKDFFVTLTRVNSGTGFLAKVNNHPDPIKMLKATMAIPGAYNKAVRILGEEYMDGSFSLPIPIKETIEVFNPTDVLVVMNRPFGNRMNDWPLWQKLLSRLLLHKFSPELRRICLNYHETYNKAINYIREAGKKVNIGVICPDYHISPLTQDPEVLKEFARHGARKVLRAFTGDDSIEIPLL